MSQKALNIHTRAFMVRLGGGECLSSLGVDKKDKRRELTDGEKDRQMDGQSLEMTQREGWCCSRADSRGRGGLGAGCS